LHGLEIIEDHAPRWSAGSCLGARVIDVLDREIQLVLVPFGVAAELAAAVSQHAQEPDIVLLEERQHTVIEQIGRRDGMYPHWRRPAAGAVCQSHGASRRQTALGCAWVRAYRSTPEEFAAHMRAETDTWRAVVHDANIKIEMIGANDLVTAAFP
jgi:hypothetical protein